MGESDVFGPISWKEKISAAKPTFFEEYFFVFLPKLIGPSGKDLESKLDFGAALEPGMYSKSTQVLSIFLGYVKRMHSKKCFPDVWDV